MEVKICTKCKVELPIDEFHKLKRGKYGVRSICKECRKKYNGENKNKQDEYLRSYREKNKDTISKKKKEYYEVNKDKIVKTHKAYRKLTQYDEKYYKQNKYNIDARHIKYYQENKEILAEKTKIYCLKNKDKISECKKKYRSENLKKIKEQHKKYQLKNLHKFRMYHHTRKALELSLPSTLTTQEWGNIKNSFKNKCAYCGLESPLAQEHFLALSKGGGYVAGNIVPACRSCNSSKRDKEFTEWYPKYKYYSKKREKIILEFLSYKNGMQQLAICVY